MFVNDKVQLIIETCKNAPTLSQLYEQNCASKNLTAFANIINCLKESESSSNLRLSSLFVDPSIMPNQFEALFEAFKTCSKQQSALNNEYFLNLNTIDLSSNCMTDQTAISFMNNVIAECPSLKSFDLKFNLITAKTLKAMCDLSKTNNCVGELKMN